MVFSMRSLTAATEKSRLISTVINNRWGFALSSSVTPTQKNTSSSAMLILDMISLIHRRQQQCACWLIDLHFQRGLWRYPAKLARLVVQFHVWFANALAGVVKRSEERRVGKECRSEG